MTFLREGVAHAANQLGIPGARNTRAGRKARRRAALAESQPLRGTVQLAGPMLFYLSGRRHRATAGVPSSPRLPMVDLRFAVSNTMRAVRHEDRRNGQSINGRGSPQPFS